MKMVRLTHDTIIQCAVKLAGNTTGTATMESEEEYAAFVLCILCHVDSEQEITYQIWTCMVARSVTSEITAQCLLLLDREDASEYAKDIYDYGGKSP